MTLRAPAQTKQKAPKPVEGLEVGDHVYARTDAGPLAVRVLARGKDGFTGECEKKGRHKLPWDTYLGHRSRMLQDYEVVDRGADGAILEDGNGRRRYLSGETPELDASKPAKAKTKKTDDPLLGGSGRMKKALPMLPENARVIMLKAQVANRPGLSLQSKTDKGGHQTHRWVRSVKDQPAKDKPSAGDKPAQGKTSGAAPEGDAAPMKHGDTVQFRHGDVGGEGKIVASGKDGVTLQDGQGNTHQVRHEHLVKPTGAEEPSAKEGTNNDSGGDGDGGNGGAGGGDGGGGSVPTNKLGTDNTSTKPDGQVTQEDPPPLFTPEETKGLPSQVNQPVKDKEQLFAKSGEALDDLKEWLDKDKGICSQLGFETMATGVGAADLKKPGGMLFIAPLKGEKRAAEKVDADYGGDWSKLIDTVRCSIAVDTYDQVGPTLEALKKGGMKLARQPKDRFHKGLPVGYRDMLLNVTLPNGIVGEVQIHVKPMLAAKSEGHHYYETERVLQAKKGEGLSPDDETKLKESIDAQKQIYNSAWQSAMSSNAGGEDMRKALEGGGFSYFDHDNAQYRRRNQGLFRSVDDVLVDGEWQPYKGADSLAPALYGDEIDDPLGGGSDGGGGDGGEDGSSDGGEGMAKSISILFLKAQIPQGAARDLFPETVAVAGHTRADGKYIAPYHAQRHKRPDGIMHHEGSAGVSPATPPAPPTPEPETGDIDRKLNRLAERRDGGPSADAKHFYVSAIDGTKRYMVAGPYDTHDEAKAHVEHVRAHADSRDPRAHFMAWGTAGTAEPVKTPLGPWKPPA